jgi:hypothetical protein
MSARVPSILRKRPRPLVVSLPNKFQGVIETQRELKRAPASKAICKLFGAVGKKQLMHWVLHNIKFRFALRDIRDGVVFASNKFMDYRTATSVVVHNGNLDDIHRKYNVVIVDIKRGFVSETTQICDTPVIRWRKVYSRCHDTNMNRRDVLVYELLCYDPLDHTYSFPKRTYAILSNSSIVSQIYRRYLICDNDGWQLDKPEHKLYFRELYGTSDTLIHTRSIHNPGSLLAATAIFSNLKSHILPL